MKAAPALRARAMVSCLIQPPVSDARALRLDSGFPGEAEGIGRDPMTCAAKDSLSEELWRTLKHSKKS
jgi:hypothetical protein